MGKQARIPKYRHHKSTGRAVVTLDGREIYLGKHGTDESRRLYERTIAHWLANGRHLLTSGPGPITVTELCAAFWKHAQVYYVHDDGQATSEVHCVKTALRRLRELYGPELVTDFGPMALQALRQTWIDGKLARRTINKYVGIVRRTFRWGVSQELVTETVYRALTSVKDLAAGRSKAKETARKRPVPETQINAVRPHVSRQVWAIVQLQLLTSARAGELVKIRPMDLDTQGNVWSYCPESHKTKHHGHGRTIWLGPRAQAVIRPFLLDRPTDRYLFSPREAEAERYAAYLTHRRPNQKPNPRKTDRQLGERYDQKIYASAIKRACRVADVPHWTAHRLRHNAGTTVRRDYGIEAARLVLGVASGDMADIYAERDHARAREIIMKIG